MVQHAANADEHVIDLHEVHKRYGRKVHALRGIELHVRRGEVFGLLGPNGAGKSTLVKILMTVVYPSQVRGTLLGHRIGDKSVLERVGYLPEHHRMPPYLTGRQALMFYGGLAGVPRDTRRTRAEKLLAQVGMTDWADRKLAKYSKGMQQRIGLAQAMVNDPDLLVLDEPTDGVDPVGRREIRDILVDLKHQGKTIFLNSHLLSELEMVCDRVAILVQGQVAMHGTIDDLTEASRRYEIEIDGPPPPWTADFPDLTADAHDHRSLITHKQFDAAAVQPLLDRLRADGRTIVAVRPVRENLEDLFMRAVTDPETGAVKQIGAARQERRPQADTTPTTTGEGADPS